jgi:MFS family permease
MVDELSLSNTAIGYLGAATALSGAISFFFWGHLIDRYKPLSLLKIIIIIASTIPLLYAISHSMLPIIFASIISGIVMNGWDLCWYNHVIHEVKREQTTVIFGIQYSLIGIRGLIAPFVGTMLYQQFGIRYAFIASASVIMTGAILMLFCRKKTFTPNVHVVIREECKV